VIGRQLDFDGDGRRGSRLGVPRLEVRHDQPGDVAGERETPFGGSSTGASPLVRSELDLDWPVHDVDRMHHPEAKGNTPVSQGEAAAATVA
jgi:hypothetical protein